MIIYLFILFSKTFENTLGTLRFIVTTNGQKLLGSILQLVISVIWILSTGLVVIDITKDPLKIVFFCMGTLIGSYLGSYLEEKIALGLNLITCITNNSKLTSYIRKQGYIVTKIDAEGLKSKKQILFIIIKRKQVFQIVKLIKKKDENAVIISNPTRTIDL